MGSGGLEIVTNGHWYRITDDCTVGYLCNDEGIFETNWLWYAKLVLKSEQKARAKSQYLKSLPWVSVANTSQETHEK